MGMANATFGMYIGFVAITLPQLLAEQHLPEAKIAAITAIVFSPLCWSFVMSPVLDVRFTKKAYAFFFMGVGALCLVGTVLLYPWRTMRGSTADIAAMGIASVAASPMAWEHHYGIVVGIAVWAWFAHACWKNQRPWTLGVAVFLCLNFLPAFNYLHAMRGWNVLQSYLYIGALVLMGWLMSLSQSKDQTTLV